MLLKAKTKSTREFFHLKSLSWQLQGSISLAVELHGQPW